MPFRCYARDPFMGLLFRVPLLTLACTAPLIVPVGGAVLLFALPRNWISLFQENRSEGNAMISTLKVQTLETDLIEKIKAAIEKRAEAKAKRMFLKRPKRLVKR
jgi:hypothetical protein